tara:strand:- start:444 stop:1346 length:903 start_codon:yes stop_codon:yes gene_type:complete
MRNSRDNIKKILIFFATYNEAENIEKIFHSTNENLPNQHLLVIDDNSPDGTGIILDRLSKNNERVNIIHRPKKMGLGTAHKLAMQYAIKNKFDILITMDADFSHHPKYLPIILKNLEGNDFVIGSRYVKGGGLGYGFLRSSLSITANFLTRNLLKIPLKECTTSYRGFQVSLLKKLNLHSIRSDGYSFFIECIFAIHNLTDRITEFPIFFYDRHSGKSKISKIEIFKSVLCLGKLFSKRIFERKSLKGNFSYQLQFKNCPNCKSHFQSRLEYGVILGNKKQKENQIQVKFQCLQCNEMFK